MSRRTAELASACCAGFVAAALLVGCGSVRATYGRVEPEPGLFSYRSTGTATTGEHTLTTGDVTVRALTYRGDRGRPVPALLAFPAGGRVKACVIYQGGLGWSKESAAGLWAGAAALKLAMFTIDEPHTGARSSGASDLAAVQRDPVKLAAMVREAVRDLRHGIDVLKAQPECRGRPLGYLGVSLGGFIGTLLAANDRRVDALGLLSVGSGWPTILAGAATLLPFRDPAAAARILAPYDPGLWIGRIAPRPVLLGNGTHDTTILPAAAKRLATRARAPKVVFTYDGGHYPFTRSAAGAVLARVAAFFQARLER